MKNLEKIDQIIFSEGEAELKQERVKIRTRDLLKKSAGLILKSLKFKNVKNLKTN